MAAAKKANTSITAGELKRSFTTYATSKLISFWINGSRWFRIARYDGTPEQQRAGVIPWASLLKIFTEYGEHRMDSEDAAELISKV
jgi:flagellar basal body rod protein FlgG